MRYLQQQAVNACMRSGVRVGGAACCTLALRSSRSSRRTPTGGQRAKRWSPWLTAAASSRARNARRHRCHRLRRRSEQQPVRSACNGELLTWLFGRTMSTHTSPTRPRRGMPALRCVALVPIDAPAVALLTCSGGLAAGSVRYHRRVAAAGCAARWRCGVLRSRCWRCALAARTAPRRGRAAAAGASLRPQAAACAPGAQGWRADTAHALTPPCPLTPPRLCAQAERWARPRAVGQRIPLHGAFGSAQQRKRVCGTAAPAGGSADLVPCSRARSLAQASSPLVQNVPVTITLSGSADFKGFLALKPSTCVPPQTGCRAPRCADQRYPIHSACAAARLAR